ncbi:MAG: response regulator [Desulfobacterales bacterium]|nr:response regulator [Desulfobacterales bacterium]
MPRPYGNLQLLILLAIVKFNICKSVSIGRTTMQKHKILAIDDEQAVIDTIKEALIYEDYEIISANDGEQGLQLYSIHQPILVILDLKMPKMTGLEFLERLKLTPLDPGIIVLTGHGSSDEIEKCFNNGINAFMKKPFNFYELVGLVRNIISLKSAMLLLHNQKLKSLGMITAGIAHDFNNILMGIMGYIELAMYDCPANSSIRHNLENALTNTKRAADLTKQILTYTGNRKSIVTALNLNQFVTENTQILKSSISQKSVLNFNLSSNLPNIMADMSQIQEVLINLTINAAEAIGEDTGTITIRTGVQTCDDAYLKSCCLDEKPSPGLFVYLEVSDTGCGMDQETQKLIFDPFFTTKFIGRGLGMSAIYGIIKGHKGAICIDSAINIGTTIRILFPVSNNSASGDT